MATTWRRNALGGWISANGAWTVRTAPMSAGRWFWLYGPRPKPGAAADRYSPTGRFQDAVGFPTAKAARDFADNLDMKGA